MLVFAVALLTVFVVSTAFAGVEFLYGDQYGADRGPVSPAAFPRISYSGFGNTYFSCTNQDLDKNTGFIAVGYASGPWDASIAGLWQEALRTRMSMVPQTFDTPGSAFAGLTDTGFNPLRRDIGLGLNVNYKADWLAAYLSFEQNLGGVHYRSAIPGIQNGNMISNAGPLNYTHYMMDAGNGVLSTLLWNGCPFPANLCTITTGASWQICPDTRLNVSYWYFGTSSTVPLAFTDASGAKYQMTGSAWHELDFYLDQKVFDNLTLTMVGSYLLAADAYELGARLKWNF